MMNTRRQQQKSNYYYCRQQHVRRSLISTATAIIIIIICYCLININNNNVVDSFTIINNNNLPNQRYVITRPNNNIQLFQARAEEDEGSILDGTQQQQQQQQKLSLRPPSTNNRRNVISTSLAIVSSAILLGTSSSSSFLVGNTGGMIANAIVEDTSGVVVEMKNFIDPLGLFTVTIPSRFYAVRRTAKGDLPDEKTGKGRRGSSIFTAGDMAKAEVIAIERYPTRVLLEEYGIDTTGTDLSTFPALGEPVAVANLITLRRERDRQQTASITKLVPESVKVSSDGKELTFQLITNVSVQKPELLLEQTGLTELVRITEAKASLQSNDGQMLLIFASALQTEYNGPDGTALRQSVFSFHPTDRSDVVV